LTCRAFIVGLLAVAGLALLDPYTSFIKGYGWLTASCFPGGPVLILVLLTVGVNVLIKLVRRRWAFTQAELMLVWCMLIVSCAIPCEGIGRYWYNLLAGGPYLARRTDLYWEDDGSLTRAPEGLVLSKNPASFAAKQYYEGSEGGRVPWHLWLGPLARWSVFLVLMSVAVVCLCAILRRQWVEVERLMFPLARVPLEFTEGGAKGGLLPALFTDRAFLVGLLVSGAFRFVRALPLLFGKDTGWVIQIPIGDVLQDTPLAHMAFSNFDFWPSALGFAFLVPADVSLSVWFFFLFSRAELQAAHWLAVPRAWGTWSPLMKWQQVGAYLAFTGGMLVVARRHLLGVLRKALGMRGGTDDRGEPMSYPVAFWGFVLSVAGCLAWYVHYGVSLPMAAAVLALLFCSFLVYARIVAQGGLYVSRNLWVLPTVLHGVTARLAGAGAVIASMQSWLLLTGTTVMLSPMAIHAFRISEVFKKRKRLLPLAMIAAILVAIPCTTYTALTQAYRHGALNFNDTWSVRDVPKGAFETAHRIITQPGQSAEPYWGALGFGAIITGFVMLMRARLYWWPIHSIGLLACSSWHAHRLWLPFLLGWLTKVGIMKLSGGRMLRDARLFFIGLIVVEFSVSGASAIVRTITHGACPGF